MYVKIWIEKRWKGRVNGRTQREGVSDTRTKKCRKDVLKLWLA
jgi:hypothetical protein